MPGKYLLSLINCDFPFIYIKKKEKYREMEKRESWRNFPITTKKQHLAN